MVNELFLESVAFTFVSKFVLCYGTVQQYTMDGFFKENVITFSNEMSNHQPKFLKQV